MTEPASLERLMARYQAGDLEAFDALYAALAGPVRQYLTALARDRGHAQDLLQETFLQLHRSRRAYRTALPVRPWIFTIARHVWLMDRRTRSRRPQTAGELPELPVPAEIERLGDRDALHRALAAVRPDRREALLLHHVWGFSFAEIAQLLGISTAAAKLRSSRGMADVRSSLIADR